MSKNSLISNTSSNNSLSTNVLIGAITIIVAGLSGGIAAGAVGMSAALYGAVIGGIIGLVVGHHISDATDIPKEICALAGSVVGAIVGIVSAKSQEGNKEIDNSDYIKGADCARKSVQNHITDALKCALGDPTACGEALKGFDDIVVCMGSNSDGNDIVV